MLCLYLNAIHWRLDAWGMVAEIATVKTKLSLLTVIHVILVAVSQEIYSHFELCLFALCVLAHYAPLGEVP